MPTPPAGMQMWQGQVEVGGCVSPPIKTVSSTASRSLESATFNATALSWNGSGTYVVEVYIPSDWSIPSDIEVLSQGSSKPLIITLQGNAKIVSGVTITSSNQLTKGAVNKIAVSFSTSATYLCMNGGNVSSDGASTLSGLSGNMSLSAFNGYIRSISYYYSAMTEMQLQNLSSVF